MHYEKNKSTMLTTRKPLTREKLERVLRVREKIIENTGGYTFDDSTEIVRQMRDERTKEQEQL